MGLFDKVKEPIFLKESSSAEKQLEALKDLQQQVCGKLLQQVEQEIKIVEAGIYGEKQILFELKNSHIPMVVIHDLYFEKDGYEAQIDYLIITRGRDFILECKNLIGNIEIDSAGNFTRILPYGRLNHKEGIYSPITQNQRHMELIKKIRMEAKGNVLTKAMFEKYFTVNYRSVVVLANPKTVLNAKYAQKEVKNQVIRADQLIAFIKKVNSEQDVALTSEKEMLNRAEFFMKHNIENPKDYLAKYREQLQAVTELTGKSADLVDNGKTQMEVTGEEKQILCPKCGILMIKRTAAKGTNAGKEFYGCSNFPKCRNIVNIN